MSIMWTRIPEGTPTGWAAIRRCSASVNAVVKPWMARHRARGHEGRRIIVHRVAVVIRPPWLPR